MGTENGILPCSPRDAWVSYLILFCLWPFRTRFIDLPAVVEESKKKLFRRRNYLGLNIRQNSRGKFPRASPTTSNQSVLFLAIPISVQTPEKGSKHYYSSNIYACFLRPHMFDYLYRVTYVWYKSVFLRTYCTSTKVYYSALIRRPA